MKAHVLEYRAHKIKLARFSKNCGHLALIEIVFINQTGVAAAAESLNFMAERLQPIDFATNERMGNCWIQVDKIADVQRCPRTSNR